MTGITYQITSKFPMYPLASVQVDIENAFKKPGGEIKKSSETTQMHWG